MLLLQLIQQLRQHRWSHDHGLTYAVCCKTPGWHAVTVKPRRQEDRFITLAQETPDRIGVPGA
jgi:hypothetical protein